MSDNKKINTFQAGDVLQQHHIHFLTSVMCAENLANNTARVGNKKFSIDQALTPAGAKTLNNFINTTSPQLVNPNKIPGACPITPRTCYEWTDANGNTWHNFP